MTTAATTSLKDRICLNVHPSAVGGPVPFGDYTTKAGTTTGWATHKLTRLELPGGRFVDYDTHEEAKAARERLLNTLANHDPADGAAVIAAFFTAE